MKILVCFLFACLVAPAVFAQDNKATVYIYKTTHARTLGRLTFPVYINEVKVAGLDGGRYFVVRLEPGTYAFRSKSRKAGGVELEAKAGEIYYLKMETEEGLTVHAPRISLVPKEQGVYDVKQMKPINKKDIKDGSLIDMNFTEQAMKKGK